MNLQAVETHGETFAKPLLPCSQKLFDPDRVGTCSLNPNTERSGVSLFKPSGATLRSNSPPRRIKFASGGPTDGGRLLRRDGCPKKFIMAAQSGYAKLSMLTRRKTWNPTRPPNNRVMGSARVIPHGETFPAHEAGPLWPET